MTGYPDHGKLRKPLPMLGPGTKRTTVDRLPACRCWREPLDVLLRGKGIFRDKAGEESGPEGLVEDPEPEAEVGGVGVAEEESGPPFVEDGQEASIDAPVVERFGAAQGFEEAPGQPELFLVAVGAVHPQEFLHDAPAGRRFLPGAVLSRPEPLGRPFGQALAGDNVVDAVKGLARVCADDLALDRGHL